MTKTALDKTPWKYSASQMNTYALCARKWAWKYIAGIEEPSGPAAALGQRVHKVLERWFKEGIPPNRHTAEGKIAMPGLDYLPLPSPFLAVERYFHVQVAGLHYRGYIDLDFTTNDGPWIVDHKTTGDFAWQKTEDDLLHDIQAMLYAKEALDRHKVDAATLMWLYYRTRGAPKAQPTILQVTRPQVDSAFQVIDSIAREMDRVRLTVVNPLDLPPDPHACEAFGGCPHIKRCGMTAKERIKAIMAQTDKKQSVADKMRARAQAAEGSQSSTPTARPVATPDMNPPEQPSEEEALSTTPPEVEDPKGGKTAKKAPKKKAAKKAVFGGGKNKNKNKNKSPEAAVDTEVPAANEPATPESLAETPTTPPVPVEPQTEATDPEPDQEAASEPKPRSRKSKAKTATAATVVSVGDKQTAFVLLHMAALIGGGHPDQIAAAQRAFATFETMFSDD